MTAREKLAIEHPEGVNDEAIGGCDGCPDLYGYLPKPHYCYDRPRPCGSRCTECWNREIPEEMKEEKENRMSECSMKIQCNNCIHEEVCCLKGSLLDTTNEIKHIEIPAFLHPIKLECTHYSPKNRTFTR